MSEEIKDNFEKGIFWELYLDLERQFLNFLEYVPYLPGNETVYSFKLLNLILSIGGHIDSAFKEMARYPEFSNNIECQEILKILRKSEKRKEEEKSPISVPIKLPLKAFEKEYRLSERRVIFKRLPNREELVPFKIDNAKDSDTNMPEWWNIYNGLKHDVGINIVQANLQNTLNALAVAFLINVRHIPAAKRLCAYGILKGGIRTEEGYAKARFDITPYIFEQILKSKQSHYPAFVETSIFVHFF